MFKKTHARQSKLFAGVAGIAAFTLLTACAADGPAEEPPADQEVEQSVQPDETQQDTPDDAATDQSDAATADDTAASGDNDPVFGVIDAVETEYDGGFIVDIDRDDDNNSQYEVDVVVDNEVHELEVTADGAISVDDRDSDDDDVAEADQATVTATDALNQAFEQHPDATFDQISLDEDDGSLEWEIDLDDANGSEIELKVPATS